MAKTLTEFYKNDPNETYYSDKSTAKRFIAVKQYIDSVISHHERYSVLDFGSGPAKLRDSLKPEEYLAVDARPDVVRALTERGIMAATEVPTREYDVVVCLGACSEILDRSVPRTLLIDEGLGTFLKLWKYTARKMMVVNVPRYENDVPSAVPLLKYSLANVRDLVYRSEASQFAIDCLTFPYQYFVVLVK